MKVVITGGGTGGHIYPALAVAEAVRRQSSANSVAYIGGTAGMEARIVPAAGLPFHAVTTRKLRKLISPGTIAVLFSLIKGYGQARAIIRREKPDVAIGTGGYVAAAAILAAARSGVPTVILSPDAVPGRTNLLLARWARRVCLWLDEKGEAFQQDRTLHTGIPVRQDIVSDLPVAEARTELGLQPDTFTVLVLGGSQGARRVNELVLEACAALPSDIQFLHQTGLGNHEDVIRQRRKLEDVGKGAMHLPMPYLEGRQVSLAYRAADVVLCRCGVSTLAEATANGVPMLLVPLPTAYADHQAHNARAVEKMGAGIHLPQGELTGEALAARIDGLRNDRSSLAKLAAGSAGMGRPDAADRVFQAAQDLV